MCVTELLVVVEMNSSLEIHRVPSLGPGIAFASAGALRLQSSADVGNRSTAHSCTLVSSPRPFPPSVVALYDTHTAG